MKIPRILAALTVANSALLVFLLGQMLAPPVAAESGTVRRGSALEIVDGEGRVRASLGILPANTGPDGISTSETVLFRLINADGQPSVEDRRRRHQRGAELRRRRRRELPLS